MTDEAPLRIDIVSDVVCPWCIIGYRQMDEALAAEGIEAEVHWHPFELNPQMAEEGENLREHVAAKYGTSPEESRKSREQMTALGAELGFTFNYADDMRMYNTFRAHQLIHWAESADKAHELKMALFTAFFTERANVSDPEVLADVAAGIGLDRAQALQALKSESHALPVRQLESFWASRGINGVPALILGKKYLVTGARGVEAYREVLRQVVEGQAA